MAFHTGRSGRHPRDGKTNRSWVFRDQSLDVSSRDVTFDGVECDSGSVAGSELLRHTETGPRIRDIGDVVCDDFKSRLLQVVDPLCAAATCRSLPDFHLRKIS